MVIEASGYDPLVPLGVSLTRFGGSFVLAGFCKHETLPFGLDWSRCLTFACWAPETTPGSSNRPP